MRVPLKRIEYEYVLETFMEEQPPLYLQAGTLLHTVSSDQYMVQNSRVYIKTSFNLINKKIVVFFNHKKRCISFDTQIQVHNFNYYFSLPDIAYKYDPDERKTEKIITKIDLPEQRSIKVYEHELFPLDTILHTGIQQPASVADVPIAYRIASQYTGDRTYAHNSVPLFLYRLYEFEDKLHLVFSPKEQKSIFMLFIDDTMMICGCKDQYTLSLENRQSVQFVIHFPHRYIHIMKGKTFFSHFIAESNAAIFGFLFEDIFEEDRRFLYENVYHEKYNPAHLCKQGFSKYPS